MLITSALQAVGLFGSGSQLALMCQTYRQGDSFGTLYAVPLYDAPASVAATCTINVAGTVTTTQVLWLYVCGTAIPVQCTPSMSNSDIAVAMVGAVNAIASLPVTASGTTFPITLTARNAGAVGALPTAK